MIWLLLNGWWLVVLAIALPGLVALLTGAWPALVALLRQIPDRVLASVVAALVTVVAVSLASGWLVGVGEERCRAKQEAAEDRADIKAAKVAGRTAEKVETDRGTISKETRHAAAEIRTITIRPDCPAVPQPARVHDLGRAAVEAARGELPAGQGADP